MKVTTEQLKLNPITSTPEEIHGMMDRLKEITKNEAMKRGLQEEFLEPFYQGLQVTVDPIGDVTIHSERLPLKDYITKMQSFHPDWFITPTCDCGAAKVRGHTHAHWCSTRKYE